MSLFLSHNYTTTIAQHLALLLNTKANITIPYVSNPVSQANEIMK